MPSTRSDGLSAVHQATEEVYDTIILDVVLPGIDGFEVLRRLREAERWTPVIMLTARDAVRDRVRGLDGGPTTISSSRSHSANSSAGCGRSSAGAGRHDQWCSAAVR